MKKQLFYLLFIPLLFSFKNHYASTTDITTPDQKIIVEGHESWENEGKAAQVTNTDVHTVPAAHKRVKMPKPSIHEPIFPREKLFPEISISGYIKNEFWWDTRQVKAIRDGHLLFFPQPQLLDTQCQDINARGEYNMVPVQTRLRVEFAGADIGNATTFGCIEGDFFGRDDEPFITDNMFRIRHAFAQIEYPHLKILAGQEWHPLFFPIESPDTIGFNTGVPIDPFNRTPQVRVTYHKRGWELSGFMMGFVDVRSFGPDPNFGEPSTVYERNSLTPELYAEAKYTLHDKHIFAIGGEVKRVVPRLQTDTGLKSIEAFTSKGAIAYMKLNFDPINFYLKGIYLENAADMLMIGGYAAKTIDPVTDVQTWAPMRTWAIWTEIVYRRSIEPAVFIGYAKDIGTHDKLALVAGQPITFGEGTNINHVFRISPRIRWYYGPLTVGVEFEFTRAAYGTLNDHAVAEHAVPVNNQRFHFACFYRF